MSRVKRILSNQLVKRSIRIDEASYSFIRKHYTGTSFEWLVNELLAAFVEQHTKVQIPDIPDLAAEEVFRELREDIEGTPQEEEEDGNS